MEENQGQDGNSGVCNNNNNSVSNGRTEPVRSRWTPKPEQILILESIFNSGMVNPPKDETVRIRKLLEEFGSVGDANVFYWFQNRRSRSRRRQRQMQATLAEEQRIQQEAQATQQEAQSTNCAAIQFDGLCGGSTSNSSIGFADSSSNSNSNNSMSLSVSVSPSSYLVGASSASGVIGSHHEDCLVDNLFPLPHQMGFQVIEQASAISSFLCSSDTSNLHYQTGFITVFINGVATEVPRGALDIKAMFGQDVLMVHSSGVPVPTNEFGFSMQSLQHGESYFLVSRPT